MNYKEIRKSFRLSQVEFAKEIGVTIGTYINWERGVMQPNKESQDKIDVCIERLKAKEGGK